MQSALDSSQTTGALHLDQVAEAIEGGDHLADAEVAMSELEPGRALLVAIRGPNAGARFLLDRDVITVGRHPDCDIFLDDITVSRRHAELRRERDRFWVHDVGSLNGTYVNGVRVEAQPLTMGNELQVGKFKLVALVPEAGA